MSDKIIHRKQVPIEETWNLKDLFKSSQDLKQCCDDIVETATEFGSLYNKDIIIWKASNLSEAINVYEDIEAKKDRIKNYVDLDINVDLTDMSAQNNQDKVNFLLSIVEKKQLFFLTVLENLTEKQRDDLLNLRPDLRTFIHSLQSKKEHSLDIQLEEVMESFSPIFKMAEKMYNTVKIIDMKFPDFTVKGQKYKLDYNLFENNWEIDSDKEVRSEAFKTFSNTLNGYKNITANAYDMHLKVEKSMADLKGYDSIFEYLLEKQGIGQSIYNRHIDSIMKHLSPHMRRYAKLLKNVHKLDEMSFEDLKISLDPEYEPEIKFPETKELIFEALKPMGNDYVTLAERSYDERWIDYAQNIGKNTGAFCYTPYESHPYIFMTFTGKMRDVFVLAHELGHAAHFYSSNKNQSILNARSSVYFWEAPSTMNEMLLANHLLKNTKDLRFKRWVTSMMVSRTYFHNFVTHLLEAAFQREVYKLVDKGESITADVLSNIKSSVLKEFWGEDVKINNGAELTWMRQPHYYLGELYPYTYSTGLAVSTQVSHRIKENDQKSIDNWLEFLKAGGEKSPEALGQIIDINILTEDHVLNTVSHIGQLIDDLYEMTEELGEL